MNKNKKAFTLVELVIVAVILSILATVWFISYEDYLADTRDSKRLSQLAGLRDSLRLSTTKGALPLPDDYVEIRNNATTFLYQWYAWDNVLEGISYSENTADPFDDIPYTYLLSRNKKDFQLLWFLEKHNADVISRFSNDVYAAVDYSQRYPNVFWKKLWILVEQQTNTPLQEIPAYTASWYMDLQDSTTTEFDAYVTDTYLISWKESDLVGIIPFTTCKKILESWNSYGSWIYNINPSGLNPFEVYCNMDPDMDGGWWTLVARSHTSGTAEDFWWLFSRWSIRDDTQAYSLWDESAGLNFNEILATTYTSWKTIDLAAKIGVIRNYIKDDTLYSSHSIAQGCEEVYPVTSWKSPCDPIWEDGKTTDFNALRYWGFVNYPENGANTTDGISNQPNDTHYFFHQYSTTNASTNRYGFRTNWWIKWLGWTAPNYDSFWDFAAQQGMIFVR